MYNSASYPTAICRNFAANFLDKPKTKAVNNGLIGLVI